MVSCDDGRYNDLIRHYDDNDEASLRGKLSLQCSYTAWSVKALGESIHHITYSQIPPDSAPLGPNGMENDFNIQANEFLIYFLEIQALSNKIR